MDEETRRRIQQKALAILEEKLDEETVPLGETKLGVVMQALQVCAMMPVTDGSLNVNAASFMQAFNEMAARLKGVEDKLTLLLGED